MSVILKPGYAPKEQYFSHGDQGPWTDIYSICATMYKLVTGVTPANALQRLDKDTLKSPLELGADITPEQEKVLLNGMAMSKENRYMSMNELMDAFDKVCVGPKNASIAVDLPQVDYPKEPVVNPDLSEEYEPENSGEETGSAPTLEKLDWDLTTWSRVIKDDAYPITQQLIKKSESDADEDKNKKTANNVGTESVEPKKETSKPKKESPASPKETPQAYEAANNVKSDSIEKGDNNQDSHKTEKKEQQVSSSSNDENGTIVTNWEKILIIFGAISMVTDFGLVVSGVEYIVMGLAWAIPIVLLDCIIIPVINIYHANKKEKLRTIVLICSLLTHLVVMIFIHVYDFA